MAGGPARRRFDNVSLVRFGDPQARSSGGWSVGVHAAHAGDLLRAFDPALAFVVVESHSPIGSGWHRLPVPLNNDAESVASRLVRAVRFDLLLTPQDAVAAAAQLDLGYPDGGLYAWQVPAAPPAHLRLLDKDDDARAAALRGVGVTLLIDLPHAGETGVLWSPTRELLEASLERLREQPSSR